MMDERNDIPTGGNDGGQQPPVVAETEDHAHPVMVEAKFPIGLPVQHRKFGFRGIIFDVDPEFQNSEEWYQAIPEEVRPERNQPFYHLFAVNPEDHTPYIAYVSEQNLEPSDDDDEEPEHPAIEEYFVGMQNGRYIPRSPLN